jgi:hypothetical protein
MTVTFAVVGHPNKGKSSIVATLAEDERIAISANPGTTHRAARYTFSLENKPLYTLVDTPGFQRGKAVLNWLESQAANASDRAGLVRSFVDEHEGDARFHDECELLRPIVEGAGILYVVDGSKPYGAEFEVEMQILQWTGQPRMALINLIGEGDYLADWRRALGQYFSIVRVFDAMQADFPARVNLLRAFAELDETWRPQMDDAIAALEDEYRRRLQRSAAEISSMLIDCLTFTEQRVLDADGDAGALGEVLTENLSGRIRHREQRARTIVQGHYRHDRLQRDEPTLALLNIDLFTSEGWELFGLSKTQLLITGSMTGAIAGLGIDAAVGGATLLLGAGIGALVGGVGSWFGADELAKTRVLGSSLGGRTLHVGPIKAVNFPWVLLGRAWVHHHLVQERNHALRASLSTSLGDQQNLMDSIPEEIRSPLAKIMRGLQKSGRSEKLLAHLQALILRLLQRSPLGDQTSDC